MIVRRALPLSDSVIYETARPRLQQAEPADSRSDLRGTYAGLASPPALQYLKQLGITAVELMPVHQFVHDKALVDKRSAQLLGIQHPELLQPRSRSIPAPGDTRRAGRRSSRPW